MELLIPGLLLVALMVWASTKIKKTAADAFETEFIETENYSLQKPEGFLHVTGDAEHELKAYSKVFGEGDNNGMRQATIEIDVIPLTDLKSVRDSIKKSATKFEVTREASTDVELNAEESADETAVIAFYKVMAAEKETYRLRFAVLSEYVEDYLTRVRETFDSFEIKIN
jgi:hypothetical protein